MSAAPRSLNRPVNQWMVELRDAGVKPVIKVLETLPSDNRLHMDIREKAWVKSGRRQGWDLLNANHGGRGNPGFSPSQETRDKLSASNKGQKRTPEQRARMSAGMRGIPKSEEHKRKISETLKGRPPPDALIAFNEARKGVPLPEETRKKQSESIKASPKAHAYWDTLRGVPLSEDHKAAISRGHTENPKTIAAAELGGATFKQKFETDPEFAAAWRESQRIAMLNKRKNYEQCDECGMISISSSIGRHQSISGHQGRTSAPPPEQVA